MLSRQQELSVFAAYLAARREDILRSWELMVSKDSELVVSASLSRLDFLDHVPTLLDTFEGELRVAQLDLQSQGMAEFQRSAAGHGVKRWQQGYDLVALVRELGRLNVCLVDEIDRFTCIEPTMSHGSIAAARRIWANFNTVGIEESVRQYAVLQREEASGQFDDLESALVRAQHLEAQRADLWQQAAHDLRGNLGVVANASVGLTHTGLAAPAREKYVRILIRNVTSLHQLLDDVTQLARLQAGRETRQVDQLDITPLMRDLCEGIHPVADQKQLYLHFEGPPGLGVQGDPVKVRRIAQNLILNAVKFTQKGGITVTWGEGDQDDRGHWVLTIADTGPGFPSESGRHIAGALESERLASSASTSAAHYARASAMRVKIIDEGAGEGLGLSIVKRLCEMLDATLERHSTPYRGTTFRVRFPKAYPS